MYAVQEEVVIVLWGGRLGLEKEGKCCVVGGGVVMVLWGGHLKESGKDCAA